ncbi:MAG: tRNA (adenosine(37)-N6)-threonylcarbamoyltransferase complex ATPase subunit type 1 TsaE [Isosphaeraceae bacterium]|nr:tRNA (adenosine(37)-N6)-threonylcarbamoyltransferase complex ATPase subunit type 1 TsaE [Isosphaeraceae bacterium]
MKCDRRGTELTVEVNSEGETEALAKALAALVEPGVVIGLIGPLGAGKTRLTRALAEALEVDPETISSPTFVLIHEYQGVLPVYHFDTYRLKDANEFEALGASDYWEAGGVCLVEWADRVADRLPRDAWIVRIESTGPTSRRFQLCWPEGSDWSKLLAARLGV